METGGTSRPHYHVDQLHSRRTRRKDSKRSGHAELSMEIVRHHVDNEATIPKSESRWVSMLYGCRSVRDGLQNAPGLVSRQNPLRVMAAREHVERDLQHRSLRGAPRRPILLLLT